VLAVEWAQRLAGLLPKDYLEVRLAILNESQRQLTFLGHGLRGRELLENLKRKTEGRKRKTAP